MSSDEEVKRKTISRSPPFPFIALDRAFQRMQELLEYSKGHAVRVQSAVQAWGYNPKSSGGIQTVGALKGFGLIDDTGSGDERKVFLSELGKRLSRNPPADIRMQLLREAALKSRLIAEYWAEWGTNRPPDNDCRWELIDSRGFTEDAAAKFLSVYDATVAFADLEGATDLKVASNDISIDNTQADPFQEKVTEKGIAQRHPDIPNEQPLAGHRKAVFPLNEGDVTLTFPASLTADGYDELGDYLQIFLKRARKGLSEID